MSTFMNFWKIKRLRCWLTTHIWMRKHVKVHQRPEIDKYHTYWRLHLPMLLIQKKRVFTEKYKYQKSICRWPNCKKFIRSCCSCSLGTWLCKEHHPMYVMEEVTSDNVTSWIPFFIFPFFLQLSLIKLSILTYSKSSFWCIYQYRRS